MGSSTRSRWSCHHHRHSARALTILILISFTLCQFVLVQSDSYIEIGDTSAALPGGGGDEDNQLWNSMHKCPNNSFIAGFSARFNEQDTKLTGLRFYCTRPHVLSELPHNGRGRHQKRRVKDVFDVEIQTDTTGIWTKDLFCEAGVVTGIQIKLSSKNATDSDNGFASDLRMVCSNGQILQFEESEDDYWASDEVGRCKEKQAACGFQSTFEPSSGSGSVRLECCTVPAPSTTCRPKKNWHKVSHCDNPISSTLKTCEYSKRIGTSYGGKEQEVQIYEDLGFHLDAVGDNLQDRMEEVGIHSQAVSDERNWLPEPEDPEQDEISTVPGFSATVYQLIGHCGFYKIRFNHFKADSVQMEADDFDDDAGADAKEAEHASEKQQQEQDKEGVAAEEVKPKEEQEEAHPHVKHAPWPPRVQERLKKHELKGEDRDELMQGDAASDPDEEWDDDTFGSWDSASDEKKDDAKPAPVAVPAAAGAQQKPETVPATAPDKPQQKDSEESTEDDDDWHLDFSEPDPPINNVPIQNSEKINAVSNPREFLVDVPLSAANLAKPPSPPAAAPASVPQAQASHQHDHGTHETHDSGHKMANLQEAPPAAVADEADHGGFFDDDFFNHESEEKTGGNAQSQGSLRDSSGFSALKPDDNAESHSFHHGHGHRNMDQSQQQQLGPDYDDLVNEGQKVFKEIGEMPIVQNAQDFVDNVKNAILDNLPGGMDVAPKNDDNPDHGHDHPHHMSPNDSAGAANGDDSNGDVDELSDSSPEPEPPKVNNAILGYIVGGMVVAVCIIVIIIFVLEKRKPKPRPRSRGSRSGSGSVKRGEYTANLGEPRLLGGGGDGKPSDKRITIEEEKETETA